MDNAQRDQNFSNTCLIPLSKISIANGFKLDPSKSLLSEQKLNYTLREMSSEQCVWLNAVHQYFVLCYGQVFAQQKLSCQHLPWDTYISSSNADYATNNYKYVHSFWNLQNKTRGFDDEATDNSDTNDNINADDNHIINNINNEDIDVENNRDWLDNFYLLSRIFILFSIVYFYSSPVRFLVVTILGFSMYLYHNGLLRIVPAAQNNNLDNNDERQDNGNPINRLNQYPQNERLNIEINQRNFHHTQEHYEGWPRRLYLIWIFFSSFFTSLIPDQNNAV